MRNIQLLKTLIVAKARVAKQEGMNFQPMISAEENPDFWIRTLEIQADGLLTGLITALDAQITIDEIFVECLAVASYITWCQNLEREENSLAFSDIPTEHRVIHKFLADTTMSVAKTARLIPQS